MQPHERSRYELIFPQYEVKKDGFVYGAQAVELFSKSGLDKQVLRDLWNMVDEPVDNRLSKLEFAIAMHLIVCITKKNLPAPKVLPASLKALKDAEKGQSGVSAAVGGTPTPSPNIAPTAARAMPPPAPQMQQPPPQQQAQQQQPSVPPTVTPASTQLSSQPPPPTPVAPNVSGSTDAAPAPSMDGASFVKGGGAVGGVSISDAFEDLDPSTAASYDYETPAPAPVGMAGAVTSSVRASLPSREEGTLPPAEIDTSAAKQNQLRMSSLTDATERPSMAVALSSPPSVIPEEESVHQQPVPAPAVNSSLRTSQRASINAVAAYAEGDDASELTKLRGVLQKLQAENIALKAQLGSMTEDERQVQKEISVTVSEIGKLSQELTGLRTDVASAKAKLIEATAELEAQNAKKETLTDLISDAQATKDAFDSANQTIEHLQEANAAAAQRTHVAPAANAGGFESDLFGFDSQPPAPAPAMQSDDSTGLQQPKQTELAPPPVSHNPPDSQTSVSTDHPFADVPSPPVDNSTPAVDANGTPPIESSSLQAAPVNIDQVPSTEQPDLPMGMGGAVPAHHASETSAPAFQQPSIVSTAQTKEQIDEMKVQALQAQEIADQAEQKSRRISMTVEELTRAAEEAEKEAEAKKAAAQGKKKRFGSNKKLSKEAEKAMQEATEKRKKALEAQSQVTDAQAEALRAKREAEQLRQQSEQAELDAAAAASVMDSLSVQHQAPKPAGAAHGAPPLSSPFGGDMSKNVGNGSMGMGFGMGNQMGMGAGTMGMGMMGSGDGGGGIPSPSGSEQGAYDNPF